jgi:hypothetical protein
MNNVFVWFTDVAQYAKENGKSYADVMSELVAVANKKGFECDQDFERELRTGEPLAGLSLEVDDIDGLCYSSGIDTDDFTHITVEEWLNYA